MLVVPSLNWVLITGLVFCCLFQWGFLCNLGANKFEPHLELSSGPGVRGWILISREQGWPHCGSARGSGRVGRGVSELIRKARLLTFPFFPVPLSPDHDHLFVDLVTTIEHELEHPLSPPRLPFLVWGDFHACSRFARSTIPEGKWGLLVV